MISFTGTPVGYFEPVIDNIGVFVDGFLRTLQIVLYAAAGSLLLGSVIAAFRVSPIPPLRWVGTSWVTVFRLPIALLDLVARGLGVDPERTSFKPLPAGSRAAALERGEVDLVAGTRSPTSGGSKPPSPGHSRGGSPTRGWSDVDAGVGQRAPPRAHRPPSRSGSGSSKSSARTSAQWPWRRHTAPDSDGSSAGRISRS